MTANDIHTIFDTFNRQKVLIIGDAMIDAYLWGTVTRMSPEAPVPVVSIDRKENRLGGAANVALNLQALGAEAILCATTGDDDKADLFFSLMNKKGLDTKGIGRIKERPTTVKTRVISDNKHLLRIDEETQKDLEKADDWLQNIERMIDSEPVDVIIFQDYNKGVITPALIRKIVTQAKQKGIPTIVDPKKKNFLDFQEVTLFKPNLKEIHEGLGIDFNPKEAIELETAVTKLQEALQAEQILLTLSEDGVYIKSNGTGIHIPAHPRQITDVSGAGDSVVSVAALCLAQRLAPQHIAGFANLAGGLVCEQVGVVPVDKELLKLEVLNTYV